MQSLSKNTHGTRLYLFFPFATVPQPVQKYTGIDGLSTKSTVPGITYRRGAEYPTTPTVKNFEGDKIGDHKTVTHEKQVIAPRRKTRGKCVGQKCLRAVEGIGVNYIHAQGVVGIATIGMVKPNYVRGGLSGRDLRVGNVILGKAREGGPNK